MKLETLKTQGELLQEILQDYDDFCDIQGLLLYSTEEQRKEIESKITDLDHKQYMDYLDSFDFQSEEELRKTIEEYVEYTQKRELGIGEMLDLYENADIYTQERGIYFEEKAIENYENDIENMQDLTN